MPPRGSDDPELELARRDPLDDGVRVGDREEDAHARVLALELAEHDRHDDRAGPVEAPSTRSPASSPSLDAATSATS